MTMIPEGYYKARALDGGLGETKKGDPEIGICFELLDEGYEGQRITWHGFFMKTVGKDGKTSMQRTIEQLRICGWQGDDLSELVGISDNEVQLKIVHDTWEGVTKAAVAFINRPGGLAMKAPMSAQSAKEFAARMKGEVIAAARGGTAAVQTTVAVGNGKKPPRVATSESFTPPPDDDIPF